MNSECKISQYANDTTLILDGSNALAFSRSIFVLDAFASISGLCVNYEKTECLWIGSRSSSTDIYIYFFLISFIDTHKPISHTM